MVRLTIAAVAATSAFAFAPMASAADLPVKAPTVVANPFTWTGCYVGGQVGYKSASTNQTWANSGNVLLPDGTPITGTLHPSGAIGGGTVGCNYQFTPNLVAGIEGDYSWTDLHGDGTLLPPANTAHTFEVKEHSFATARLRLGYAVDHWLLFISGGAAWARVDARDFSNSLDQTETKTHVGWTIGAGGEYAFTNHWSAKVEYLYADLGTERYSLPISLGGDADVKLTQHVFRIGVNYKF